MKNLLVFLAVAAACQAAPVSGYATCSIYRNIADTGEKTVVASSTGTGGCAASFGGATASVALDDNNVSAWADWGGQHGDDEYYTASYEFNSSVVVEQYTILNPLARFVSYAPPHWSVVTVSEFNLTYMEPEFFYSVPSQIVPSVPFTVAIDVSGAAESALTYAYAISAHADEAGSGLTVYDANANVIPTDQWGVSDVTVPEPMSATLTAAGLALLLCRSKAAYRLLQ